MKIIQNYMIMTILKIHMMQQCCNLMNSQQREKSEQCEEIFKLFQISQNLFNKLHE